MSEREVECDLCGEPFTQTHGLQKLCPDCRDPRKSALPKSMHHWKSHYQPRTRSHA